MKKSIKYLSFLSLIILSLASFGQEKVVSTLNIKNGLVYEINQQQPYTGKFISKYKDGHNKEEINYKNGKKDGLIVLWYENGQKRVEGNYKNNKKEGLAVLWYENGQKLAEGNYKNDKLEGLFVSWHENGQKKVEGIFKNNEPTGDEKCWNKKGEIIKCDKELDWSR